MAKNNGAFIILLALFFSIADCVSQTCLEQVYLSQIGVREATGKNDGVRVESYLKNTGLGKGYPWCAAFVKWCFNQCGMEPSISAWSSSAHNSANIVMMAGKYRKHPMPGDVFTIWNMKLKRIGHTGFFHRKINESFFESVEGNTNAGGSSEGDGVYMRKRSINSTYSITRWTNTK